MSNHPKVFISHTMVDRPFAEELSESLTRHGIKTLGPWELGSESSTIEGQLQRAITQAGAYVILVSEHSLKSPWLNFELGVALGSKKTLVFVYLSESARSQTPEPMRRLPAIDASALRPEEVAEQVATMV